jgi:uncharacterized membrane protein YhdT
MITLFIFYAHTIAAVAFFTQRWQSSDWKEGLLGVGFLALIFSVGWSITTFLLKLVMEEKGFGRWFDRDTASLALLAIIEAIFFYYQLKRKKSKVLVVK